MLFAVGLAFRLVRAASELARKCSWGLGMLVIDMAIKFFGSGPAQVMILASRLATFEWSRMQFCMLVQVALSWEFFVTLITYVNLSIDLVRAVGRHWSYVVDVESQHKRNLRLSRRFGWGLAVA